MACSLRFGHQKGVANCPLNELIRMLSPNEATTTIEASAHFAKKSTAANIYKKVTVAYKDKNLTLAFKAMLDLRDSLPPIDVNVGGTFYLSLDDPEKKWVENASEAECCQLMLMEASWLSNTGLLCHGLGRSYVAEKHFVRALDLCACTGCYGKESASASMQLNCGYGYMCVGKWLQALSCLRRVFPILSVWPMVWLRLAETCIALHTTNGAGTSRRRLSRNSAKNIRDRANKSLPLDVCSVGRESQILTLAALFARYALRLERSEFRWASDITPSRAQQPSEVSKVAMLLLAYVHLELRDAIIALEMAEALMKQPHSETYDDTQSFAVTYASEARNMLGSCWSEERA